MRPFLFCCFLIPPLPSAPAEECHIWDPFPTGQHCVSFDQPVFDSFTGQLLWAPNTTWHLGYILDATIDPHVPECPKILGRLTLEAQSGRFYCACTTDGLFAGPHCDHPTDKLVHTNRCQRVGWIHDPTVTDITRFDPVREGICTECSIPGAVPMADAPEPFCSTMFRVDLKSSSTTTTTNKKRYLTEPCVYDAMTGQYASSVNRYVPGYGCACDFYNGYVEVYIPGLVSQTDTNNNLVSNPCVKIGQTPTTNQHYHRTDILYYALINNGQPLQTHTYEALEPPFSALLTTPDHILLIDQPTRVPVHAHDWLNRHVKPGTPLYRYHKKDRGWPVVHKCHYRNQYTHRGITRPLAALDLKIGQGFETRHWYELTDSRRITNAIKGHPILYGSKDRWAGLCTLNPLGVREGYNIGLSMLVSPGRPVRMDTRNLKKTKKKPVLVPPDFERDMVSDKQVAMYFDAPYLPFLFITYHVQ